MSKLDAFDIEILKRLQVNNRITSETLADEIGLSPTACQRRIKRLRASGAISADISVVSPDVVGGRVTLIVEVVLERGRVDIVDAFKRDMRTVPEVQQCYYVTGDCDFILIVTAEDIAAYEQLTRRIFFDNPHIHRFNTIVSMETVKAGLEVPL